MPVSRGPRTIDDEPMDTTRPVSLMSKCLSPDIHAVPEEEWLPKQELCNTWLGVKPMTLFYSDGMGIWNLNDQTGERVWTPQAESPVTTVAQHQQFLVTEDILNALLKLRVPAQDEGDSED